VATFAATVGVKASEAEAVEGIAELVAVVAAAAAVGRLPVTVVVAAAAGVGRFAAAAIVVVLDGKATSVFRDKSIQKLFIWVRADRSARPRTLARYGIGRVF
jgi:hypothetical protein